MEPHLSLRWILLVGGGFLFWWLRSSRKEITRDVGKGVNCVPEIVRFLNADLFLRRGSHRLNNHTISYRGDRLRWGDFDKLGSGCRFLCWSETTAFTTLSKASDTPILISKA